MSRSLKSLFWIIMTTALAFGFFHHLIDPKVLNFERLHIFLFNLCSGGTMLVYFTEDQPQLSWRGRIFLCFSLLFALCAFMQWYGVSLVIPLVLASILESVRMRHFGSFLPRGLFSKREKTATKFHQTSLLCLSLGLVIASLAILNSEYGHWLTLDKLKLDTSFLGFSFPLSQVTMSVIFGFMKNSNPHPIGSLKEISFWAINLGVIIFFLFILANWFIPQILIASTLFLTVALIFYLYWYQGKQLQQKDFLTSGILFLLVTSVTGILYILLTFSSNYDHQHALLLLRMHTFTALYGWNLSGLIVISRHRDFPLRLHSRKVLFLHWLTVLILCPLGYFYPLFAIAAVICYGWLLAVLLFNKGRMDHKIVEMEDRILNTET